MPLNMCTATIQELMTLLPQDLTYESAGRLFSVLQRNPLRSPQQLEIFSGYPAEAWRRLVIDGIITFSSTSVPNHPSPNKEGSGSDISYTSTRVNSPSNSTSGKKDNRSSSFNLLDDQSSAHLSPELFTQTQVRNISHQNTSTAISTSKSYKDFTLDSEMNRGSCLLNAIQSNTPTKSVDSNEYEIITALQSKLDLCEKFQLEQKQKNVELEETVELLKDHLAKCSDCNEHHENRINYLSSSKQNLDIKVKELNFRLAKSQDIAMQRNVELAKKVEEVLTEHLVECTKTFRYYENRFTDLAEAGQELENKVMELNKKLKESQEIKQQALDQAKLISETRSKVSCLEQQLEAKEMGQIKPHNTVAALEHRVQWLEKKLLQQDSQYLLESQELQQQLANQALQLSNQNRKILHLEQQINSMEVNQGELNKYVSVLQDKEKEFEKKVLVQNLKIESLGSCVGQMESEIQKLKDENIKESLEFKDEFQTDQPLFENVKVDEVSPDDREPILNPRKKAKPDSEITYGHNIHSKVPKLAKPQHCGSDEARILVRKFGDSLSEVNASQTELHSEGGIEGIGVVKPETENEGLTSDKYGKDEILVLETVNDVGKIQSADPIMSSVQHPGLAVDHHIPEELMSSQEENIPFPQFPATQQRQTENEGTSSQEEWNLLEPKQRRTEDQTWTRAGPVSKQMNQLSQWQFGNQQKELEEIRSPSAAACNSDTEYQISQVREESENYKHELRIEKLWSNGDQLSQTLGLLEEQEYRMTSQIKPSGHIITMTGESSNHPKASMDFLLNRYKPKEVEARSQLSSDQNQITETITQIPTSHEIGKVSLSDPESPNQSNQIQRCIWISGINRTQLRHRDCTQEHEKELDCFPAVAAEQTGPSDLDQLTEADLLPRHTVSDCVDQGLQALASQGVSGFSDEYQKKGTAYTSKLQHSAEPDNCTVLYNDVTRQNESDVVAAMSASVVPSVQNDEERSPMNQNEKLLCLQADIEDTKIDTELFEADVVAADQENIMAGIADPDILSDVPVANITCQHDPLLGAEDKERDETSRQDALNSRKREEGIRTRAGRRVKPPAHFNN